MSHTQRISRRGFLRGTAAAAAVCSAAPYIVPASALGRDGAVAASERITLGVIGMGPRNQSNLPSFLAEADVQCVTVCDCFADRRKLGKETVDRHYGNSDCRVTRLHEELLDRKDLDALLIATGDRWHAVLSVLAAKAGKDVYCEKPVGLTIAEGRTLVDTTRRYGTVWQCGTQRRSNDSYRFVVEAVRGGMIGKLHTITAFLGGWGGDGQAKTEPAPDPEVFDYERWLGQSPWAPYSPVRVQLWRNNWDTAGGVIADMGAHYFDFAQWAHDTEFSGPVEFAGTGVGPQGGFSDVPFEVNVEARYADGVKLLIKNGPKGVRFDGDAGWIHLSDEGELTAEPKSILATRQRPAVNWAYMGGHVRNFLDCIKSRRLTVSHPELAHRAHTIVHCANLCMRLGRKLNWDPVAEKFAQDDEANRMLERTMRLWQHG